MLKNLENVPGWSRLYLPEQDGEMGTKIRSTWVGRPEMLVQPEHDRSRVLERAIDT
jgi:hypothetical protein